MSKFSSRLQSQRRTPAISNDVLVEILRRLPAKCIGRFRCISKQWLFVASDPIFLKIHSLSAPVSGFFLLDSSGEPYQHVSLGGFGGQQLSCIVLDPSLPFLNLQDCCFDDSRNGVILCHRYLKENNESNLLLFVCNPLTRDYVAFSGPYKEETSPHRWHFTLAFDCSTAPHFKVVAIGIGLQYLTIHMYSSKARSWELLFDNILLEDDEFGLCHFKKGIFWESSIVWLGSNGSIQYLDMKKESLGRLPSPQHHGKCLYFGESAGRLHVIWSSEPQRSCLVTQFDIFEMESGCSGWTLLHTVDLGSLQPQPNRCSIFQTPSRAAVSKICFLRGRSRWRGEKSGDQLLVSVYGKIVSYHPRDKLLTMVCSDSPTRLTQMIYSWSDVYPHVHTLLSVKQDFPSRFLISF